MQYKSKIFKIHDEQYLSTIHILHSIDDETLEKYVDDNFPGACYERDHSRAAMCIEFTQDDGFVEYAVDFMIRLKSNCPRSADTIAHEASHLTWNILADRGIEITPDNNEMFAYFLGFLVTKITAGLISSEV